MARGVIYGVTMACQRCSHDCPKTGYAQKYCKACQDVVYRGHWAAYKKRKRAADATARKPIIVACQWCGISVKANTRAQKFCALCRKEYWRVKSNEKVRRWRDAHPEQKGHAARRQRDRRLKNPAYAISARMSAAVYQAIQGRKGGPAMGSSGSIHVSGSSHPSGAAIYEGNELVELWRLAHG